MKQVIQKKDILISIRIKKKKGFIIGFLKKQRGIVDSSIYFQNIL